MVVGLCDLEGGLDRMWCCDKSFRGRAKVCELLELRGGSDTLYEICGHVGVARKWKLNKQIKDFILF